jgi:MFS family permease
MLFLLSIITYLDRVCISVAMPQISKELGLSPSQIGWVLGVFTIAYGAFEVPGGWMADRFGARKVLTRIVVWWSAFTALTGAVTGFTGLWIVRALFGAGEAGAYPSSSSAISRWFPPHERARSHGFVWMASRLGGAIAPGAVIWLQTIYGWRAAFYIFAIPGLIWAVAWYVWFRDHPRVMKGVNEKEIELIGPPAQGHRGLPFLKVMKSGNLWAIMAMYHTFCYGSYWYIAWAPTYLVNEKHIEGGLLAAYSSLPFLLGAMANGAGGFTSDRLVKKLGLKEGRRAVGVGSLFLAGALMLASLGIENQTLAIIVLMAGFGAADFCLPNCWAVCLDIGKDNAGTVTGAMNTAGQIGASIMSIAFGALVESYGYNAPLVGIALLFFVSASVWFVIDPTKPLVPPAEGLADELSLPKAA